MINDTEKDRYTFLGFGMKSSNCLNRTRIALLNFYLNYDLEFIRIFIQLIYNVVNEIL